MFGKKYAVALAIPDSHKSLQYAGALPKPTEHFSTLFSTLSGKTFLDVMSK